MTDFNVHLSYFPEGELVKASDFYTATKFPDTSPRVREPKKAEVLDYLEK
ncbi:Hypothetical protein TPAS_1970 [Trichococcus pasteurii]|uniref:Uncharacterized protein n=1 Tax=Trichococcus pasteurii TaxID=43064 RepID=A0A1W1IH34_9LACT|nr:hypothetical protein SAMN04488086_11453 [Trichococcus pasteurii]SLM52276.1 Hypothetical protein TPAS_1970 [Trichococcus pasteurii]SSB93157.1 Hypothetical protein TPAS_1970 [Trichococcus pasteurii]